MKKKDWAYYIGTILGAAMCGLLLTIISAGVYFLIIACIFQVGLTLKQTFLVLFVALTVGCYFLLGCLLF